jgi:multicomponent Na+:H+ antiporter subunit E
MKVKVVLFLIAFLVWSLLNWVPDWQHLFVGIFIAWLVAFTSGDLFIQRPHILKQYPLRYWYFIVYYLPRFLWECLKANVDVAYRVLHPKLPINPGIVKVKTNLKSDTALTFLANSITLTPGTLSVDIDRENSLLYVHWIDVKAKDVESATKIVVERFEKILQKIFD